ncbi:uncharacterized protein V6R79_020110 [Siganus canaliculatus]
MLDVPHPSRRLSGYWCVALGPDSLPGLSPAPIQADGENHTAHPQCDISIITSRASVTQRHAWNASRRCGERNPHVSRKPHHNGNTGLKHLTQVSRFELAAINIPLFRFLQTQNSSAGVSASFNRTVMCEAPLSHVSNVMVSQRKTDNSVNIKTEQQSVSTGR